MLVSCEEQERFVHWNGPNIPVHAGISGAVQVHSGQYTGLLLRGQCCGCSTHRVAYDSNLGQIQMALPEVIVRSHLLELVENESHICHQDLVRELANSDALSSSIGFCGPVGRESDFM